MQPLSDNEVTPRACEVKWRPSPVGGGTESGAHAVQPLSDIEVTPVAGEMEWLLTINTLRPHARAVCHRCLRCRQVARLHGFEQPHVRAVACARA